MMTGVVTAAMAATLRLIVNDTNDQPHDVDAMVDTGFTGFLTLPPALLSSLGCPWIGRQFGLLADGNLHVF
jgi:predicted aspartyl protease